MRPVYLVSVSPTFQDEVWRAAADLGARVHEGVAQFHDRQDGSLLTVFGSLDDRDASDWRDDLVASPRVADVPDLSSATAVTVECRSETLVASWVARLAALLPEQA